MKGNPAVGRIALGATGVLLLAALLYLGPPATGEKSDWALGILATALSILAGILIAVITMLGDPRRLYPGNWRIASAHRREIGRALNRFAMLFWLYLAVIALALIAAILEGYIANDIEVRWVSWLKHVAISVGSVALLWSFSLPAIIRKAQLARLTDEVESRRRQRQPPSDGTDSESRPA